MTNTVCVLEVVQHSDLEKWINEFHIIYESYMVWEDTGERVKYPLPVYEPRKRKYIDNSYFNIYFNDVAKEYSGHIRFVSNKYIPPWGSSWWIADHNGLIKLYKENWDSSD